MGRGQTVGQCRTVGVCVGVVNEQLVVRISVVCLSNTTLVREESDGVGWSHLPSGT